MTTELLRSLRFVGGLACLSALPVAGGQQAPAHPPSTAKPQAPQTLPGGASQMQETHGDWRVTCVQQPEGKFCAMAQQLADKDSRQLVVGIELKTTSADTAEGTLIMPFGLALEKPVTMQVDDAGTPITARYRTCVPAGCLVPLTFDGPAIATLKKGTALSVKATADGGKDASFRISLSGFGSAFDRTAALSK
jgi:invasion protein IalB